ncbi:hypothetical protein [Cyanobium sp. ATX-6F1]|uniref:hypothetical protein n=1 Tax=Cyanobium sp. ATX-6F1 TaxID=3137388 RepID=UPI0039BE517A
MLLTNRGPNGSLFPLPLLSLALPPAPPPPPPLERSGERLPSPGRGFRGAQEGLGIELNGQRLQARWRWLDGEGPEPAELWIPLEVLQGQMGFSSRSLPDGELELDWFGQSLRVPAAAQRSLQDEVAIEVSRPLLAAGARPERLGPLLRLRLPPPQLLRVRSRDVNGGRRVVLDLSGPTWLRQGDGQLALDLASTAGLQQQLQRLGLGIRQGPASLSLALGRSAGGTRISTLGGPNRVVIDLPVVAVGSQGDPSGGSGSSTATETATEANPRDPRLLALQGSGVQLSRELRSVGQRRLLISSVRLDPRRTPWISGRSPVPMACRASPACLCWPSRTRRWSPSMGATSTGSTGYPWAPSAMGAAGCPARSSTGG